MPSGVRTVSLAMATALAADRLRATIEQRVAGATAVPQLQENTAAGGMHRVGDQFPAGDLGGGTDARLRPEGRVAGHDHGGLGDQQAGTGALRVVFRHEAVGNMLAAGPTAGQRVSGSAGQRRHENVYSGR